MEYTEKTMELTIKDRLILANQYKILEGLYSEEYGAYIEILERGYVTHYKDLVECFISDEFSKKDSDFVEDVLEMYSDIYYTYEEEKGDLLKDRAIFRGFDGNNETTYMSYCRFLMEDLNYYENIKKSLNNGCNSHCPMIDRYKKMLIKYRQFVKEWDSKEENKYKQRKLPINQIKELLNA